MTETTRDDQIVLPDTSHRDARHAAIKLLSRREHSSEELKRKLLAKGFTLTLVEQITHALQQENLLSDERFAECYQRSRRGSGYGPVRIAQELKQRGTDPEIISAVIDEADAGWFALAKQVREKRFGLALPSKPADRAKQMRFLQYRGFTHQQLTNALNDDAYEIVE